MPVLSPTPDPSRRPTMSGDDALVPTTPAESGVDEPDRLVLDL
ncbi:hypothetical protein [Nocardiopsis sp. SBT366]|nr:hypothetical protein [Nocardiopsis sp. SBT366]